jgi:hypothetical protein
MLGEEYRSLSSSLCSFLHFLVTSSLLDPNILNTLFSNTLSQRSSLNVSDQISHPYKTTGKIIVVRRNITMIKVGSYFGLDTVKRLSTTLIQFDAKYSDLLVLLGL